MPRRRKFIITALVVVIIFAVYKLALGSPPIPLPPVNITAGENTQLSSFMRDANIDSLTITMVSNGEISTMVDETNLAMISYTTSSLYNAAELGLRFVPRWVKPAARAACIVGSPICVSFATTYVFYYYIIPVKLTFVIHSN